MLELRDVSRSTGKEPILVRASFACGPDSPTSILGLSAAGREGVLNLISGADRPQAGTIRFGGRDITEARKARGAIVRIGSQGAKPSGRPVGKVIGREEAARTGLDGKLGVLVKDLDLSGRVRLAIAAALAERPKLVLLNAPASEIGGAARAAFVADMGAMFGRAGGMVIVLAAGSADEALAIGGDAIVMDKGEVTQAGKAGDVFAHPANLAAAMATSWPNLNTLRMTAEDGAGRLADGAVFQPPEGVMLPEGACTLAFRPEDATVERAGAACLRFVARTTGEADVGGRKYVRLGFGGAAWLAPLTVAAPHAGAVFNVFVDRSKIMIFDAAGKAT